MEFVKGLVVRSKAGHDKGSFYLVLGLETDMAVVCKCISSGSLRGARGNSGVILSQLLRGFTKIVKDHDSIDCMLTAEGFEKAVVNGLGFYNTAFQGVRSVPLVLINIASDRA